jgi:putative transposase
MSRPRCVLPGDTYLITRRCSERRFFLRPSPAVNAIVLYCLALAAHRFGVDLHAFSFLSNHYHLIVTDRRGQLPLFMHDLNLLLARALNARNGHFESFWAPGTYSVVRLTDADAILEKMAYTLANPVSAGLVSRADLWPGVSSRPCDLGAPPRMVSRPPEFFRREGPSSLPAEVPLVIVPPPGFADVPLATLREQVATRLADHEERARRHRRGRGFLGRRRVLLQPVFARPADDNPHFGLNPRVAGRDKRNRIEALLRLRSFLAAYREAWTKLKAGFRNQVVFPAGTWRLRRELGVPCEAPS